MKKAALALLFAGMCFGLCAQKQNPEFARLIKENPLRAGVETTPYEYRPNGETPAPKGYKAFYISHYGRHGSRSAWEDDQYSDVVFKLSEAKSKGLLTPSGDSLLYEASKVLEMHDRMDGRLTQRGVREHKGIGERMYDRFTNVFTDGSRKVRVISSTVPRCIISMSSFTTALGGKDPNLKFSFDCGEEFQKYIATSSSRRAEAITRHIQDSVERSQTPDTTAIMTRLFTDPEAARPIVGNIFKFEKEIFATGRVTGAFDFDFNIFRFLPQSVVYQEFDRINTYFYLTQCNSKLLGLDRMTRGQSLINDIVEKADQVLYEGDDTAVDLRFGHDYPSMAMASFLGFKGVGEVYDLEEMRQNWFGSFNSPFAGNVQLIFYRSKKASDPILVKFLHNERETSILGLEPKNGPYYSWEEFKSYLDKKLPVHYMGPLHGRLMRNSSMFEGYQGMDIWGDYLISCQNRGTASIYKLEGRKYPKQGEFRFGSYSDWNHSNVASFLTVFADPSDPLPLVGISHCNHGTINGMKDPLYIERIAPDFKSSTLVRTINYDDVDHDFGYALQWVVDRKNNYLYGYGNTIDNTNPENRHRVIKFRLPDVLADGPQVITLHKEDALENYLIEDTWNVGFNPIGQGLYVLDGKLYMPTGVGTAEYPSILYIWDLETRSMDIVDLSITTFSELEDVSVHNGDLVLQAQDGLFRMPLK